MMRLLASLVGVAAAGATDTISQVLQQTSDHLASKYNMSIAVAYVDGSGVAPLTAAAGYTDAGLDIGVPTRAAQPDDVYVWGSVTKMFTAPAVLKLVEEGAFTLDDYIPKLIDPFLTRAGSPTLEEHFDSEISHVRVRDLLHMTSGITDYDGESYSKDQFANKSKDFSPLEILQNYVPAKMKTPGFHQSYCSTGYILLGMLLASHYNVTWQELDQAMVLPSSTSSDFNRSMFVDKGECSAWTPVHGIMQGYSTASLKKQDVWNVSCTGGWTAGNYLGSVADVATYTYDLYGPDAKVVSAASQKEMINFGDRSFYGMGTFQLDWSIGTNHTPAYGHVGDTYGYQSQTTYFPHDGKPFVVTVATNIELDSQIQPAEATCLLYNAIAAIKANTTIPECTFVVPHRFIGTCTCK